jgi:hypothetical protein
MVAEYEFAYNATVDVRVGSFAGRMPESRHD